MTANMDRYDLYELCVQDPPLLAQTLWAIHGGGPRVLGEDFCGTAALSRRWVQEVPGGRAVAADRDPEPLARARGVEGVRAVHADVMAVADPADLIYAGNFSIGELHARADLTAYLRHTRGRLSAGGVFVCDTYGGESAFMTGHEDQEHPGPDGTIVRYRWEQREADPLTGMVTNVLHFRVSDGGRAIQELPEAFVYRWRLWSVPELRDAMAEAGFSTTEVFSKFPDAVDESGRAYVRPIQNPADLDESFVVCIAGRL